jgi:hypothetical protein
VNESPGVLPLLTDLPTLVLQRARAGLAVSAGPPRARPRPISGGARGVETGLTVAPWRCQRQRSCAMQASRAMLAWCHHMHSTSSIMRMHATVTDSVEYDVHVASVR